MHALRPWFVLTLLTCALLGVAGCSTMQRWLSRDESERHAIRLQEVQLKVMRYADDYGGRMRDPLAALSVQSASPERRLDVQNWRITQTTAAYTIASGPNPVVNALDMVVLATLSRLVVEHYWQSAPDETTESLHEVVDRAFWRGIVLIAVLAFAALFVALAYRYALLHVRRTPSRPRHAGEIL